MNMLEAPPGTLDLIPWKLPCDDDHHHHDDAFDLNPHLWSHLPENLLHSILELLPFQSILRFRCVCTKWKALFGSPTFHHFASHSTHIPPWIFFIGRTSKFRGVLDDIEESPARTQFDDGRDDNGYVFEDDVHGDSSDDSHMNASDDPRDAHDVARHEDHGDMHDAIRCGDHEDMHDVTNHGDTHDVDGRDNDHVNGPEKGEDLLLIFDCKSESWRPPIVLPPGFKSTSPPNFFARYSVCSFQEQVLIPASSLNRLFLFNPASPSCKELPPFIGIKELEGLGLSEESASLSSSTTSANLSSLSSLSNENRNVEPFVQDRMAKVLQVVAVGTTGKGTYVVESFNFITGSWHICGYLLQSDDNIFAQMRMVFCKGSFYARVASGILMMNNVLAGRNMECTFLDFPIPPNLDDAQETDLTEMRLVSTKDSVFLVGATFIYAIQDRQNIEDWDIIIWQFHPLAPEDACWQLLAYTPKSILDDFYYDIHISTIDCFAHGDLIFFHVPNRQRFLIYDVPQKLWRFSAKCEYFLGTMTFVWEPSLRN